MRSPHAHIAVKLAAKVAAALAAAAVGGHPHHTLHITATEHAQRWAIAGTGRNIWIEDVRADGHLLTLTQNNNTSAPLYIYGEGVVVAMIQRGRRWTLRAVSVQGRRRITLTYWVTG